MNKIIKEDFFNPFDEKDEKKEVKHISDKSNPLYIRKETFNLARIEFSKRPGGEFTILAKTHFAKNEIIEICPCIILGEEAKTIDYLKDVIFEIDKDNNEWALVLGYGSLYRHADKPNVDYAFNKLTKQMYFITKRPIKQAEELTINYGQDYWAERMNFNLSTSDNNNEIISSTKVSNESEIQNNTQDIQSKKELKTMSSPTNPHNPVRSGVAIIGTGQS